MAPLLSSQARGEGPACPLGTLGAADPSPRLLTGGQEQLSGPRGSGFVQVRVESFWVMTTLAVALPS